MQLKVEICMKELSVDMNNRHRQIKRIKNLRLNKLLNKRKKYFIKIGNQLYNLSQSIIQNFSKLEVNLNDK